MRPYLRLIAITAVMIVAALPVATVVCAYECTAPRSAAAAASEHCHQPEPSDALTLNAATDNGCDTPFQLTDVAARDRSNAPVGLTAVALLPPQARALGHAADVFAPVGSRPPPDRPALPAGTRLPLRI